jgi:hypothetical protein
LVVGRQLVVLAQACPEAGIKLTEGAAIATESSKDAAKKERLRNIFGISERANVILVKGMWN